MLFTSLLKYRFDPPMKQKGHPGEVLKADLSNEKSNDAAEIKQFQSVVLEVRNQGAYLSLRSDFCPQVAVVLCVTRNQKTTIFFSCNNLKAVIHQVQISSCFNCSSALSDQG